MGGEHAALVLHVYDGEAPSALTTRDVAVRKSYCHRTFPHRRSAPLDGTVSHISGGEDAWDIRLHIIRIAVELPIRRAVAIVRQSGVHQIGTGHKISCLVAEDADFLRPLRVRQSAQAEKKPAGFLRPFSACLVVSQRDRTQDVTSVESNYLGVQKHLNPRTGANAIHQILRNAFLE